MEDDFATTVLNQLSNSIKEEHQHICTVLGTMSQELKDQNIPLSPVAYFGATCSTLDRLSTEVDLTVHTVEALLVILSMVMKRVLNGILVKKSEFVNGLVDRVLRCRKLSDGGVVSCLKCVSKMLTVRENVGWSDVSPLYTSLVSYITDSRPKVNLDFFGSNM